MSRPNDALEVIEMLDKSGPESHMNFLAQYDQLKDELRRVKALTYEDLVPHGHWISLTDCSNAGVYCSVCHKKVWKEDYAWCNKKNKLRSNYCPNCGAKMDK